MMEWFTAGRARFMPSDADAILIGCYRSDCDPGDEDPRTPVDLKVLATVRAVIDQCVVTCTVEI